MEFLGVEIYDTDLISEYLRDHPEAIARFRRTPKERRFTTIINEIEVLVPRYRYLETADTIERIIDAQVRLNIACDLMRTAFTEVLPMDLFSGRILAELSQMRGLKKIGHNDLLIASIALRHDAVLVTGNVKHFSNVPRLKSVDFRA
ncbi:MAG: PIN domain-containing protein [Armatimonadetes bacterium]|nr:PIN domain-containing protein [Armatimonadota bacterium]